MGNKVLKNGKLYPLLRADPKKIKYCKIPACSAKKILTGKGPDCCTVYLPLSPRRQKATGSIPTRGAPLCGVAVSSLCLCEFFPGIPTSSRSPKTHVRLISNYNLSRGASVDGGLHL